MLCGCLNNTKYPTFARTFTLGLLNKYMNNKTKTKTTFVVLVLNLLVLL